MKNHLRQIQNHHPPCIHISPYIIHHHTLYTLHVTHTMVPAFGIGKPWPPTAAPEASDGRTYSWWHQAHHVKISRCFETFRVAFWCILNCLPRLKMTLSYSYSISKSPYPSKVKKTKKIVPKVRLLENLAWFIEKSWFFGRASCRMQVSIACCPCDHWLLWVP